MFRFKKSKNSHSKSKEKPKEKSKGKSKGKSKEKTKENTKEKSKERSKEKLKEKSKEKSIKSKKSDFDLERPQTPYFLFCSKKRNKKLTAKELGDMWKKLPEDQKKVFNDQYQETKKKYDKAKEELKSKSDEESDVEQKEKKGKIKFGKVKAKTKKEQVDKNNLKACNCGRCAECKKLKGKPKNPEEDESEEEKEEKNKLKDKDNINGKLRQKPNENINFFFDKHKDIPPKNKQYKFTVGSRKLKAFGKRGKLVGAAAGAVAGALAPAVSGAFMLSPFCAALGAYRGVKTLESLESAFDQIGALHVCLLLGDDIFEYGDEGYARHKNIGKTSEYDWNNNFEIEGVTKVSPDELEEKIIQKNEWVKDKYDEITHNCHSFIKFCCDIIEPDSTIMSVVLVPVPQHRLFRAW